MYYCLIKMNFCLKIKNKKTNHFQKSELLKVIYLHKKEIYFKDIVMLCGLVMYIEMT